MANSKNMEASLSSKRTWSRLRRQFDNESICCATARADPRRLDDALLSAGNRRAGGRAVEGAAPPRTEQRRRFFLMRAAALARARVPAWCRRWRRPDDARLPGLSIASCMVGQMSG